MKSTENGIKFCGLLLLVLLLTSCSTQSPKDVSEIKTSETSNEQAQVLQPTSVQQENIVNQQLPVHYQNPSYVVDVESLSELDQETEEIGLKVGANIVSTRGPEPLGDVLRILARSKGFTISWASDVEREILVDVNIGANDDFHKSIENLLRQVDYFHEFKDNTIIVKYKETRQFHIAMPFTTHNYKTGTGGNVLGGNDASTNVDGTIELKSDGNEFDIWKNIQENMDKIIATWNTSIEEGNIASIDDEDDEDIDADEDDESNRDDMTTSARQVSKGGSMYMIDKPVGLITVSAPRPLLDRLETYFSSLKRELYKQINIEAKIIEVQLSDNSSIGINWSSVLNNFALGGTVTFGQDVDTLDDDGNIVSTVANQIWPNIDSSPFVRTITMNPVNFSLFVNALEEEGDTNILSNPKISVMNGQPALITVGRNTTYIESIEADSDSETGVITYTAETERILSGVGLALTANILDDREIIMNLVPVTSELESDIEYRTVGLGEVGLPVVNVREMSTTVKVRTGEMLVIGGLIDSTESTEGHFAPILGGIPIVRYLFGYEEKVKQKRELIILLKPTIIN